MKKYPLPFCVSLLAVSCLDLPAATFSVTTTNDSGAGSLRAAISNANATAGPHVINFAIPPFDGTVKTITPLSELDHLLQPVTVDGYTQPGARTNTLAAGDNAVLLIELNGSSLGFGANGLSIGGVGGSTVRGLVINRFPGAGVRFDVRGGNVVEGNFIGTDSTGTTALGNHGSGVSVGGPSPNLIGGTTPSARNIISGNSGNGIEGFNGGGTNLVIQGNYIGTDKTGTVALPNAATGNGGIVLVGVTGTLVGGAVPGAGNLISANHGPGIFIFPSAPGTVVAGNIIGADVTGTLPMGNALDGVGIQSSANNVIGGTTPGAGNIIAFNGAALTFGNGSGVQMTGTATNNAILGNSIFGNAVLGIDLFAGTDNPGTRVSTNDPCDVDDGPNHVQNFPVLTSVAGAPGGLRFRGLLNGKPNTTFRLEFFLNPQCDPSGYGEGQRFLGFTNITTGADCTNIFDVTLANTGFGFMTATATDPDGNTSEFAACVLGGETGLCAPAPAGLVSWWPGNGNAADITGGDNGTPTNNATFAAGKVGQAFRFDGSGDAVLVGNPTQLRLQSFTIDAWIKRASATVASLDEPQIPAGAFFSYGLGGYAFGILDDGELLFAQIGASFISSGPLRVTDTDYHHVAVTKSGSTVTFYVDGAAGIPAGYNASFTFTSSAAIGAAGDTLRYSFLGDIDEVEIFNRALSLDEIRAILAAGSAGKCNPIACTLAPSSATNAVGTAHTLTATVTSNAVPVTGATVNFNVISGPNAGASGSSATDSSGHAGFTYTSNGQPGTDTIRSVATVSSLSSTCTATEVWISSGTVPTIMCPPKITTNNATGQCGRTVAFAPSVTGDPAPTVTCQIGSTVITSPHFFPVGATTVTCTASNSVSVASCSFTVTISDTEPPLILCPTNLNVQCDAEVPPPNPALVKATDNCDPAPVVAFVSDAPKGTCPKTIVRTYQATDAAGNSAVCTQTITVHDTIAPVISDCANITVAAALGQLGTNVNFTVTATDNCDGTVLVSCTPSPGYFALGMTPVTCEAVDRCGNRSTCAFIVTVTATTEATRLCSFTQGFYGNASGKFNGNTSFTLVGQLLGQGPLVVGKSGARSLSILAADAALLQQRLPAGGTPAALPGNGDQTLKTAVLPLNAKGRFANVLLGQTITLALNTRLSPALRSFGLASSFCSQAVLAGPDALKGTADDVPVASDIQTFSVPTSVLSALASLGLGSTVEGLLELANRALAGLATGGASLADINAAVDAINRGFDECRVPVNCATSTIVPDSFNDSFTARATLLSGPAGAVRVRTSNLSAQTEPGEPNHAGNAGGKSLWWQWRAPRTGVVAIQTAGSGMDTLLAVYTGTAFSNLVVVASNDDANRSLASGITFTATLDTDYLIAVDGFDGASGSVVLTLIDDPPRMCQPVVVAGTQVQLCVSGELARVYTVEASPDLFNWTMIAAPLNSDGTVRFMDPAMSNNRLRFYRISFEP